MSVHLGRRPAGPSSGDLVAAVTVALVAVPQSLAYAELAGLPAQRGLYAAALPAVAAAAFASSRHLQTGAVALTALLSFGALAQDPAGGGAEPFSDRWVALAALLALLVGAFRVGLGLLRLGRVAYVLSEPVLSGFTTGAAILIVSSQLPKALGVESSDRGVLIEAGAALTGPEGWHGPSLGFAAATAVVVVAGRRLHRLFPGVLVAVVAAIVVSWLTGFDGAVVGALDGAFPRPPTDLPLRSTPELLVPALSIALVGFAEPASIARRFAAEDRERWDADREMIGQGVANLAAAASSAFPVGGSFSRTSLSRQAGATSRWAGAVTGLLVLAALPLVPLLAPLPRAVLAAIVITAVVPLIDPGTIWRLTRLSPAQAVVAGGTLVATLAAAPRVERGVLVGVGLAVAVHLYRELQVSVVGRIDGDRLTVAPRGVVWFLTVPAVDRLVRNELAGCPTVTAVEVDLAGVGRLDYTGAAALARMAEDFSSTGIDVTVVNVPPGGTRAASIHLSPWISRSHPDGTEGGGAPSRSATPTPGGPSGTDASTTSPPP